jgi:hypothetical protein
MENKITVQLDKERELVFDNAAILELDEVCGINVMRPSTYYAISPKQLRDLVWAGQLHTKKPLTRAQVGSYLPLESEAYAAMAQAVADAVSRAILTPEEYSKRMTKLKELQRLEAEEAAKNEPA